MYRESSHLVSSTLIMPYSRFHAILNLSPIYNTLRGIHVLFPITKL